MKEEVVAVCSGLARRSRCRTGSRASTPADHRPAIGSRERRARWCRGRSCCDVLPYGGCSRAHVVVEERRSCTATRRRTSHAAGLDAELAMPRERRVRRQILDVDMPPCMLKSMHRSSRRRGLLPDRSYGAGARRTRRSGCCPRKRRWCRSRTRCPAPRCRMSLSPSRMPRRPGTPARRLRRCATPRRRGR